MKLLIYTLLFLFFFQYLCMCNKNLTSYKNELEKMTKTEKLQSQLKQVQAIVNSFPLPSKTLELWTKQAWLTNKQTNDKFHYGHIR